MVLVRPRHLTDASQSITDTYTYQAYGALAASTGTTANPFRWIGLLGYFYDSDRQAYYIRARHYSPLLARWLSQDPIGLTAGASLYEYASNCPASVLDPTGLHEYLRTRSPASAPVRYGRKLSRWQKCKCVAAATAFSAAATACCLGNWPACCVALGRLEYLLDDCWEKQRPPDARLVCRTDGGRDSCLLVSPALWDPLEKVVRRRPLGQLAKSYPFLRHRAWNHRTKEHLHW